MAMLLENMNMSLDEFVARFVAYLKDNAGFSEFGDGTDVEDYARRVAPTYWENSDQRIEGPEACAISDMEYWGEE